MNSNKMPVVWTMIIVSWMVLLDTVAQGQDLARDSYGFIRLLDAVSEGTGKLECLIDGKPVRPDGYQLGNVTGGIAMKPVVHKVMFRREGVRAGETQVQVAANVTTILIPFAELIPATDDHPARWEIRILKLKQQAVENQRTATFVSVSREPELRLEIRQADGKWEALMVKRLGLTRTNIQQSRGYLPVRHQQQLLTPVSVAAAGNFVSVLYEDEKGVLRSRTFQDYKYLSSE